MVNIYTLVQFSKCRKPSLTFYLELAIVLEVISNSKCNRYDKSNTQQLALSYQTKNVL